MSPMFTNGKMDSGSALSYAVYGITLSLLAMTALGHAARLRRGKDDVHRLEMLHRVQVRGGHGQMHFGELAVDVVDDRYWHEQLVPAERCLSDQHPASRGVVLLDVAQVDFVGGHDQVSLADALAVFLDVRFVDHDGCTVVAARFARRGDLLAEQAVDTSGSCWWIGVVATELVLGA